MNSTSTPTSAHTAFHPDTAPAPADRQAPGAGLPPVLEVAALVLLSGGTVAAAEVLGPTSVAGNIASAVGLLGCFVLVLVLHWLRGDPWSALGLGRPASWLRTSLLAVASTGALYLLGSLILAAVSALLGATPDTSRFDALRGNLPALLATLAVVWVTAALVEEVVFRGFLMGRLAHILGGGRAAWIGAAVLGAILFGGLHAYQGVAGVLITGFMGLLLGLLYLLVGRNLWVVILAHGLVDTISLVAVYLGIQL